MRQTLGGLLLLVGLLLTPRPLWAISEADRFWLIGQQAFRDQLYVLSRQALEQFLRRHPQDRRVPEATLLLAKSQLALGAFEAALKGVRRAQRFVPPPGGPQEARFWEAETLFKMKRHGEARAVYQALLDEDAASPRAPDALYGVAWSDLQQRRREPALAAFRKLLDVWPDHPTAPLARFHLARALTESRQYGEAAELLAVFPSRHPRHPLVPDAAYLRGVSLVSAGKRAEGVRDLRAFVAAYPGHELVARAKRTVTEALLRNGDEAELTAEYAALQKQSPLTAEGLYDAVAVAQKLGKEREAEVTWRRLASRFPDHALTARASLSLAEAAFKRREFNESLALAQRASESRETTVRLQALLLVGESELRQKHPQSALKAFQSAEALESDDRAQHFRAVAGRGLVHEELGQLRAAVAAYEAVAAESPDRTLRQWAQERLAALRARPGAPARTGPSRRGS